MFNSYVFQYQRLINFSMFIFGMAPHPPSSFRTASGIPDAESWPCRRRAQEAKKTSEGIQGIGHATMVHPVVYIYIYIFTWDIPSTHKKGHCPVAVLVLWCPISLRADQYNISPFMDTYEQHKPIWSEIVRFTSKISKIQYQAQLRSGASKPVQTVQTLSTNYPHQAGHVSFENIQYGGQCDLHLVGRSHLLYFWTWWESARELLWWMMIHDFLFWLRWYTIL